MDPDLRESIARYMWLYWKESNGLTDASGVCPPDFYHMAEISIQLTQSKIVSMILNLKRNDLEKIFKTYD